MMNVIVKIYIHDGYQIDVWMLKSGCIHMNIYKYSWWIVCTFMMNVIVKKYMNDEYYSDVWILKTYYVHMNIYKYSWWISYGCMNTKELLYTCE